MDRQRRHAPVYDDHVHFPLLSVFLMWHWLYWTRWISKSISLDSIVSIKASQMLPNTYSSPCGKKFPDQDFTIILEGTDAIQHFPKDNNACDILIEYAGGIKHINDYIHRLSIDSFNLSETEDGHALQLRGCIPQLEYSSAMARLLRTADEKELFLQQGAERLLVADHDRY